MEPFICRDREKHSANPEPAPRGRIPTDLSVGDRMRRKLLTKAGRRIYAKRKQSVEPVFGQMKTTIFRQNPFLLRGQRKAKREFRLSCIAHNLKKIARHIIRTNNDDVSLLCANLELKFT